MIELPKYYVLPWFTGQRPLLPGCESKIPFNALSLCSPHFIATPSPTLPAHSPQTLHPERLRTDPEIPKLAPYQTAALQHSLIRRDAALWHVVGAGKTRVALSWGLLCGTKLLYLTRASARRTGEMEVAKWTNVKCQVLTGTDPYVRAALVPGKRKALVKGTVQVTEPLDSDAHVYIIGYEVLPYWCDVLCEAMKGAGWAVVFDEVHHVKAYKRKRSQLDGTYNRAGAAKQVSLAAARRLAITGTPVRDRPRDLWAELDLIEPGAWGSNWAFVHRYCDARENAYGGLDTSGRSNEAELRTRLDQIVHRVGYSEVTANLPPKIRSVLRIPSEDQVDIDKARRQIPKELNGKLPRSIALAAALKLDAVIDLCESKFDDNAQCKLTVFTYLRSNAESIEKALRKRLPNVRVFMAHGGTSVTKRDEIRTRYMTEPGPTILVGTGDSWGESVSLNDTDFAVFAALPFTPGQIEQQEGRFHRKGQLKRVELIFTIAVGTVDEHVANVLLNKLPAVDTQVALGGTSGMTASLEDAIGMSDESATTTLMAKITAGGEV